MVNKQLLTNRTLRIAKGHIRSCVKLPMYTIAHPEWKNLEDLNMIFKKNIHIGEQSKGNLFSDDVYEIIESILSDKKYLSSDNVYEALRSIISEEKVFLLEEFVFQPVIRVISGKVYINYGRPFAYPHSCTQIIGTNSPEAFLNLSGVLKYIPNYLDKRFLIEMLYADKTDNFLITTPEEKRLCIEVTRELYEAGLTSCIDWWTKTDENGKAEETKLNIGDFLIVSDDRTRLYYMSREEFVLTHSLEV